MSLHMAVRENRLDDVRRMLQDPGVDVNAVDEDAETPFDIACRGESPDMVRLILDSEREINYNQEGGTGWTALHYAFSNNNQSIMSMLLADKRMHFTALTHNGNTCLHIAARDSLTATIQLLIASGRPDAEHVLGITNNEGYTIRDVVELYGRQGVELLDAYTDDPVGTRDQLRIELGWPAYVAAELFATIVLLCDEYYEIKE